MADYGFYTAQYLGQLIPEADFPPLQARAERALARILEDCVCENVLPGDRDMAVCAMADTLYLRQKSSGGIRSAAVGDVQVHYDPDKTDEKYLYRDLYRSARLYLNLYRGCSRGNSV